MCDSVTVSMAELSSGMLSAIEAVTRVRVSAVLGNTEERAGTSSTSSKVNASRISIVFLLRGIVWRFPIARIGAGRKGHSGARAPRGRWTKPPRRDRARP
ncbi:MAG: hypothetical protein M5U35_08700 [Roseovarius sp.]|nr:hypothetical protein [Roseovarius sp.]